MYRYSFQTVKCHLPDINIQTKKESSISVLNTTYSKLLEQNKNKIDIYYDSNLWDKTKKIINPYEMIYITNKKIRYRSISTFEPLSRSFFKMIEMSNIYLSKYSLKNIKEKVRTLHLAEGPGGFIEGWRYYRDYYKNDVLYGITLISDSKEIPSWKKSINFLRNNPQIKISYGNDGTGDLYNYKNINYLATRLGNNSIPIITGDGGFDFSVGYNNQEMYASKLIFSQIITALKCQSIGGTFIVKFFDINNLLTLDLLFLLQCCYRRIEIYKPYTSRVANSERYIICIDYKKMDSYYLDKLLSILIIWNALPDGLIIDRIFKEIPIKFYNYIDKINWSIIKQQVDYINKTIEIINNKHSSSWYYTNEITQNNNAYRWCIENKIPYK
jgi:hypothetical protein